MEARNLPVGDAIADGRWLSPVSDPSKIVGIGLNYVDHATEATMAPPSEPLVFAKFPSSIIGPGATIHWSRSVSTGVDYEAELAVVIGGRARDVPLERALDHVFGYRRLNDVSARDLQFGEKQWVRGKSLDSFCPIGPHHRHGRRDPGPAESVHRVPDRLRSSSRTPRRPT